MREFNRTYYIKTLNEDYVKMVKEMWNDGYVEVVNEERTRRV